MTDSRDAILDAAARCYAEGGFKGTTTRRVAELAGVNEVTLFRHFGTKSELIRAALQHERQQIAVPVPDADTADPVAALAAWAEAFHAKLFAHRALIRQILGDASAHPELAMDPCDGADLEVFHLVGWLAERQRRGDFAPDADVMTAAHLLVNGLFTDAIWRDMTPVELLPEPSVVVRAFTTFALRGLGYAGPLPDTRLPLPASVPVPQQETA